MYEIFIVGAIISLFRPRDLLAGTLPGEPHSPARKALDPCDRDCDGRANDGLATTGPSTLYGATQSPAEGQSARRSQPRSGLRSDSRPPSPAAFRPPGTRSRLDLRPDNRVMLAARITPGAGGLLHHQRQTCDLHGRASCPRTLCIVRTSRSGRRPGGSGLLEGSCWVVVRVWEYVQGEDAIGLSGSSLAMRS
jgi:hypothetical protein